MTCKLMTPWWLSRASARGLGGVEGGIGETPILDWRSDALQELVVEAVVGLPDGAFGLVLQRAHALIAERVKPVYAVDDAQPVSRTLARGRGSCSQRLAVLEAVARAVGVATRVRGLVVDGRFWYPRFPHLRFIVPDAVVLAWPEFLLDGQWIGASEMFGSLGSLSRGEGFTNADGETLFDALTRTAVDWDGVTSPPGECSACDLSATVLHDLGRFQSRDELFALHGQTLSRPARTLSGPILGRWSAGSKISA